MTTLYSKETAIEKILEAVDEYVSLTHRDCTPLHMASKIKRAELTKTVGELIKKIKGEG